MYNNAEPGGNKGFKSCINIPGQASTYEIVHEYPFYAPTSTDASCAFFLVPGFGPGLRRTPSPRFLLPRPLTGTGVPSSSAGSAGVLTVV